MLKLDQNSNYLKNLSQTKGKLLFYIFTMALRDNYIVYMSLVVVTTMSPAHALLHKI